MSQASTVEREMLELINEERTSRGLNPLQLEQRLNDSAETHSEWMLDADVFSHTGEGNSSAGDRMRDAGFQFSGQWRWAENIAWQSERGSSGISDDVANLHQSLMNSPGHRANILNPQLEYIGIGVEVGNYNGWSAVMVTQNFAATSANVILDGETGGDVTPPPPLSSEAPIVPPEGTSGNDTLTLTSSGEVDGGAGRDLLNGSGGNDTVAGGRGSDTVIGNEGADKVVGGAGADLVQGGSGADRVIGGGGSDTVDGGTGNDALTGSGGSDTFVFSQGSDVIKDYEVTRAGERIDLDDAVGVSSYGDLVANHMWERDGDVIIRDAAGNRMFIQDVSLEELDSGDFVF